MFPAGNGDGVSCASVHGQVPAAAIAELLEDFRDVVRHVGVIKAERVNHLIVLDESYFLKGMAQ